MPTRRPLRTPRALAATAVLAALALLTGCYSGVVGEQPAPTATRPVVDGPFADYFGQQVDWSPCDSGFECATILAPMDWEDETDPRTVSLAAIRHVASGPDRIGSLFVNPGGPGASGVDFVRDNLSYILSPSVVERYDVVGWDPRGTGASAPVTCYTDPEDISDFLYGISEIDPAVDPDGWAEEQLAEGRRYADACEAGTGEVLEFIDTLSTVRDLELLRVLSGDDVLNYLGYSYGTAIGSIYVDEYPETVGRVVLDGVVDREQPLIDGIVAQQAGFELALTNFVEACPGFADCPLSGDPAIDLPRIHGLVEAFEAAPVAGGAYAEGRVMTGGTLATAISQALYAETFWPALSSLFAEVTQPSPVTDIAWQLADMYNDFTPGVGYASNLQDALWAIYCVDYPVDLDPASLAEAQRRVEAAAPTLTLAYPPTPDPVCSQWPYSYRGGQHERLSGTGAAPVLIVSTTGDPATPYEAGVKLSEDLESGVLVTFDGEGHTAYSAFGNQCVVDIVDAYLLDGVVPDDGVWCDAD